MQAKGMRAHQIYWVILCHLHLYPDQVFLITQCCQILNIAKNQQEKAKRSKVYRKLVSPTFS